MNREIKFRVYDYDMKKIRYLNGDHDFIYFDKDGNAYYHNMQTGLGEWFSELMQFTGLKDKNGVEIYEGDIIRLDDEYRKLISSADAKCEEELCRKDCLVGFKGGAFMFGRNRFKMDDLDSYLWLTSEHCEVIGNIYEVESE